MFVTTATVGVSARNERSYSSASTTYRRSLPPRKFPDHDPTRPPTSAVGSRPAAARASAVMTVVVVFPCVPATPTNSRPRVTSPSASARRTTGTLHSRARNSSGWSFGMADVTTRARAPETCAGSCVPTLIPSRRRSSTPVGFTSHPVTFTPRRTNSSARALMPAPAIPTKCTGLGSAESRSGMGGGI